jgi:Tfp pilus assembly protein PilX
MKIIGRDENGIVLAVILVFLLLLSLSGLAGGMLSRTDIQIVRNQQQEREAFYVAEAGVTEALLRLTMTSGTMATAGGSTFDASISPNAADPAWSASVLFSGSGPVTSGSTVTTPTIQASSDQLPYSTAVTGSDALKISWLRDAGGAIKTINGRRVLEIASVGRVGTARRRVTQQLTKASGVSIHVNSSTVCPALRDNGNTRITTAGDIQVNSTCSTAIRLSGSSSLTSNGGAVNVVGGVSTPTNAISPDPAIASPSRTDPLAAQNPPCFTNGPTPCRTTSVTPLPIRSGSANGPSKLTIGANATLSPGIYYGGVEIKKGTVTLNAGTYVMAGGGFTISSTAAVTGSGVTIFNTLDPSKPNAAGAIAAIDLGGSGTINLSASTSVDYPGILFYQDRRTTITQPAITITGGFKGVVDGIIYAIGAELRISGSVKLQTEMVVDTLQISGNAAISPPPNPYSSGAGIGWNRIAWIDY